MITDLNILNGSRADLVCCKAYRHLTLSFHRLTSRLVYAVLNVVVFCRSKQKNYYGKKWIVVKKWMSLYVFHKPTQRCLPSTTRTPYTVCITYFIPFAAGSLRMHNLIVQNDFYWISCTAPSRPLFGWVRFFAKCNWDVKLVYQGTDEDIIEGLVANEANYFTTPKAR